MQRQLTPGLILHDVIEVQARTFTKWINIYLDKAGHKVVTDLFSEFKDGRCFLTLLRSLANDDCLKSERGNTRFHHLNNINHGFQYLCNNFNIQLNLSADQIADGDRASILHLLWQIILKWQVKDIMAELTDSAKDEGNIEHTLLTWCQESTAQYANVQITDFSTSWRDGQAFNALLHKYRPNLYENYQYLMDSQDEWERLEHAFELAKGLGITPLLEAQDMYNPDKKSIIMYLMSYFHVLVDAKQLQPSESMLSLVSGGVTGFYDALEKVLVWLTQAEHNLSVLADYSDDSKDICDAKKQFHDHEEFMLGLTEHQGLVGSVLQAGNHIVSGDQSVILSEDEEKDIKLQTTKLRNRWEDLRVNAMHRQTSIQESLTIVQQAELTSLSQWLSKMEDKIQQDIDGKSDLSRSCINLEPDDDEMVVEFERLQYKINEHKELQKELEQQQVHVDGLNNLIVIVDENNPDNAYALFEQQLESLGKRWAEVCKWFEERSLTLEQARDRWNEFDNLQEIFASWLSDREDQLSKMRLVDLSEVGEVVNQVQQLQVIENAMDVQMEKFDDLLDHGVALMDALSTLAGAPLDSEDKCESALSVHKRLQQYQERWDAVVLQMETQSKKISKSGVDLNILQEDLISMHNSRDNLTSIDSIKKPKIDSKNKKLFDSRIIQINEWFERARINLELLSENMNSEENLTFEEKRVLIEDTDIEIKEHKDDTNKLHTLGKEVIVELKKASQPTTSIVNHLEEMDTKYNSLIEMLTNTKNSLAIIECSNKYNESKSILTKMLTAYSKWIKATENESMMADSDALLRNLEQCKLKVKSMQSHNSQLKGQHIIIETLTKYKHSSVDTLTTELSNFEVQWKLTFDQLSNYQIKTQTTITATPSKAYRKSIESENKFINSILLKTNEEFIIDEYALMKTEVVKYQKLRDELELHDNNADQNIFEIGEELITKANKSGENVSAEKLSEDLANLKKKRDDLNLNINTRLTILVNIIDQFSEYENQSNSLNCWINDMELFLKAESPAFGDLETLNAQLTESMGVQDDISTLQKYLDNIDVIIRDILMADHKINSQFKSKFTSDVSLLNERWDSVLKMASEQKINLEQAIKNCESIIQRLTELTDWLIRRDRDHGSNICIETPSELRNTLENFRIIKEELAEASLEKNKINEEIKQIKDSIKSDSNSGTTGSTEFISGKEIKMNELWSAFHDEVGNSYKQYESADSDWKQLELILKDERDRQNILDRKLKEEHMTIGDAEEISEILDEFESGIRDNTTSRRSEIELIAGRLISSSCLVTLIRDALTSIDKKQMSLETEIQSTTEAMMSAVHEAQEREGRVFAMTKWMNEVNALLQKRVDADILASDMPDEYKTLKLEITEHESTIESLQKLAKEYKEKGATVAVERLEQQAELLQKHFTEVMQKFRRYERPGDFDSKLANVWKVLKEVNERVHLIELRGEDSDLIADQLEHCMAVIQYHKFYKTMTEVKPQVESVIKVGRQVVEKKQVDFPDKLSKELDSLKLLYNTLGSQVTKGKSGLDKALKLAKKLKLETVAIYEITSNISYRLDDAKSELTDTELETELAWIEEMKRELERKQPILPALNDIVTQLSEVSETGSMANAENNVEEMIIEIKTIESRLDDRHHYLLNLKKNKKTNRNDQGVVPERANKVHTESTEGYGLLVTLQRYEHRLDKEFSIAQEIQSSLESHRAEYASIRLNSKVKGDHSEEELIKRWQHLEARLIDLQSPLTVDMFSDRQRYGANLNKLLGILKQLSNDLECSVLTGNHFNSFSEQEDKLKEISSSLRKLEPVVKAATDAVIGRRESLGDLDPDTIEYEEVIENHVKELSSLWIHVNSTYVARNEVFDYSISVWKSLHMILNELSLWFTEADLHIDLSAVLDKPIENIKPDEKSKAIVVLEEIESMILSKQSTINELNKFGEKIISATKHSECIDIGVLKDNLSSANNRWEQVLSRVNVRRSRLNNGTLPTSDFTEDMDELFFWIDETEHLISLTNDADSEMLDLKDLKEHLIKIEGRIKEIPIKERNLFSLNATGECIISDGTDLSSTDIENISTDMEAINSRWKQVLLNLNTENKKLTEDIKIFINLSKHIGECNIWTEKINEQLKGFTNAHVDSITSTGEQDSIIVDYASINDVITRKQIEIDEIHRVANQHTLENNKIRLPITLKEKVKDLEMKFNSTLEVVAILPTQTSMESLESKITESESEDVFESNNSVIEETHITEIITEPIVVTEVEVQVTKLNTVNDMSEIHKVEEPQSPDDDYVAVPEMVETPAAKLKGEFDGLIASLEDRLTLLARGLRRTNLGKDGESNSAVLICDLQSIEETIVSYKNALQEIQANKLRIKDLSAAAETLDKMAQAQVEDGLKDPEMDVIRAKENKIVAAWLKLEESLMSRIQELGNMNLECRQFESLFNELERWIKTVTPDFDIELSENPTGLKQQIETHKKFEVETSRFEQRVKDLNRLSETLKEDYYKDNSSKLDEDISNMNECWSVFMKKLECRGKQLNSNLDFLLNFDKNLSRILETLEKDESAMDDLDKNSINVKVVEGEILDQEIMNMQKLYRDLQSEIDIRSKEVESLSNTANKIINQDGHISDSDVGGERLKSRLKNMNDRWIKLRTKSVEIRTRLETPKENSIALLNNLKALNQWILKKKDNLEKEKPIAGDYKSVNRQIDNHRILCRQLNDKSTIINHTLSCLNSTDIEDSLTEEIKIYSQQLHQEYNNLQVDCDTWQTYIKQTSEHLKDIDNTIIDIEQLFKACESEQLSRSSVGDILLENLTTEIQDCKKMQDKSLPIQSHLDILKNKADTFERKLNIVLSHTHVEKMENLNKKWKTMKTCQMDRLQQLEDALRDFGPNSQNLLSSSVHKPWEREITKNQVPYYINHQKETTQWDHPELHDLFQNEILHGSLNEIKFSAYRTGLKFREIQKKLHFELVSFKIAADTFDAHRLRGKNNMYMSVPEIINALTTLYERAFEISSYSIPLHVDLALNWILKLYDGKKEGEIKVLSFKIAIILLCKSQTLEEKYKYIFRLVANKKSYTDKNGLTSLLKDLMSIPNKLGEGRLFGKASVEPSVNSCFEKANNPKEIAPLDFIEWTKMEPQSLVWLPVNHRISASENSKHGSKCSHCKVFPIIGVRYRCTRCFNVDLCQKCFLLALPVKGHKSTHNMREYCLTTSSSEDVKDITRVLKNKFHSKRYHKKHPQIAYLPVSADSENKMATKYSTMPRPISKVSDDKAKKPLHSSTLEIHSRLEHFANKISENKDEVSNDEHKLIAKYCNSLNGDAGSELENQIKSPVQILNIIDNEQSDDLEKKIQGLEYENRNLQEEYDILKQNTAYNKENQDFDNSFPENNNEEEEMLEEARLLRQHKGRLETRMHILEGHNKQLESQLKRLKTLLDEPEHDGRIVSLPLSAQNSQIIKASRNSSQTSISPPQVFSHQNSEFDTNIDNDDIEDPVNKTLTQVGDLFKEATKIGDAFGSLVTVITDDEGSDCEPPPTATGRPRMH